MKILVTGCAGFIGFNLIQKMKDIHDLDVWGIDNFYFRSIEENQLKTIRWQKLFEPNNQNKFWILDMNYKKGLWSYLEYQQFDIIIHLASIPGVRDSIENSDKYITNNIGIFNNLLEFYKDHPIECIIYASSSSVYGNAFFMTEKIETSYQLNQYAFTKKSMELLAKVHSHLYKTNLIGLRFFTVYGPWGRPDMAYYKWTKSLFENKSIEIFGDGNQQRDFTYIDSIIEAIIKLIQAKEYDKRLPIYNLGNHSPEKMIDIISYLEKLTDKKAVIEQLPTQGGDMTTTFNISKQFEKTFHFDLNFPIEEGLKLFVEWYEQYQRIIIKEE